MRLPVTGTSRGIGRTTAPAAAARGWSVAVGYRGEAGLGGLDGVVVKAGIAAPLEVAGGRGGRARKR